MHISTIQIHDDLISPIGASIWMGFKRSWSYSELILLGLYTDTICWRCSWIKSWWQFGKLISIHIPSPSKSNTDAIITIITIEVFMLLRPNWKFYITHSIPKWQRFPSLCLFVQCVYNENSKWICETYLNNNGKFGRIGVDIKLVL